MLELKPGPAASKEGTLIPVGSIWPSNLVFSLVFPELAMERKGALEHLSVL